MPELPEVETAARQLRDWVQGRRLIAVQAEKSRVTRGQAGTVGGAKDDAGLSMLAGHRLLSIERQGKWMLLSFDRGAGLLSHLGMTGKWIRRSKGEPQPSHVRATFEFEGRVFLDYRDPRLFGRLLAGSTEELRKQPTLVALGPDPLGGIDVRKFAEALGKSDRSIKEVLMDQRTLAGLGNIQVSESLFRAKLHPERPGSSLDRAEVERLARAIDESLRFTLSHQKGEDPIEYVEEGGQNFFLVYGRAGEPCSVCKTPLQRIVQGGRSTFFCPSCQAAPVNPRRRTTPPTKRPPVKVAVQTKSLRAKKTPAKAVAKKAAAKAAPIPKAKKSPAKARAGKSSGRGR